MGGSIECDLYKKYFILECRGELPFQSLWEKINHLKSEPLFSSKSEAKRYSRYIFTRDKPGWTYPPYCRYGYHCSGNCKYMLWKKSYNSVVQLTLF